MTLALIDMAAWISHAHTHTLPSTPYRPPCSTSAAHCFLFSLRETASMALAGALTFALGAS